MSIERTDQGSWRVSDVVAGSLVVKHYFYFTKLQAVRKFKRETQGEQTLCALP